ARELRMRKKSILRSVIIMGIALFQMSCSVFGIRSEETPKYEILVSEGNKEIRSYSGYIVAKTTVKGDFRDAQGEAFRILAGYIFGGNEKKQKISMTAPVMQEKSPTSENLSMTAPVVQSPTEGGWVMTFMMPSGYKLADLPTPKDKRVEFEEVNPKIYGVIRYSGLGRQSTNEEMANELQAWLKTNGQYEVVAGPSYAGYDPPWTIPFFRRNEMMYELRSRK
ncbi:MAG: heme-binding protein, partial [Spirochaetes bacterium]|nr:heme-binding protein [Spirochaetota bacterium]